MTSKPTNIASNVNFFFIIKGFLTLYTKRLPLDCVCIIWDMLFVVSGHIALYKAGIGIKSLLILAILMILEEILLKKDLDEIVKVFKNLS